MKLEFKHIASYLPYKLKVQWTNLIHEKNINLLVGIIENDPDFYFVDGFTWFLGMEEDDIMPFGTQQCKLILKPLSDLTEKEINKIDFRMGGLSAYGILNRIKANPLQGDWILLSYLFEKHYDVFDLIGHGLAVDINDLEN